MTRMLMSYHQRGIPSPSLTTTNSSRLEIEVQRCWQGAFLLQGLWMRSCIPPRQLAVPSQQVSRPWPVFVWCRSLPVSSFFFHVSVYLQFIPHPFLRTPGFEFSAQFKEASGMISPWIISAETQFVLIRSYSKVPAGRIGKCVWDGHRSTCHSYQKYIIHFEYWVSYSQEYVTTVKMWLPGTLSEYSMVLPSKYFSSLNHYVGESL